MSLKVCLDAGHGGKDSGAVEGKRYEKDDVLKFVKRLGYVLKSNGVTVTYTRTTDVYDSPSQKAKLGNATGADLFVSVHRNAYDVKTSCGVETLICNTLKGKYDLAKNVNDRLVSRGYKDRGVKLRNDLAVLNQTSMIAILLEIGFITNVQDNERFDGQFYTLVNDVARGILSHYGITFKTVTQLKAEGKIK